MKITTRSGFHKFTEANSMESIADRKNKDALFTIIWIYPASARGSNGKLVANTDTVFIGEETDSGKCTPDPLPAGDGTPDGIEPMVIELPQGTSKKISDVIGQANAPGDGVWYKWWPAPKDA